MLITLVDVVSCENPECREFARIVSGTHGARSYYCPVCGTISLPRAVGTDLVTNPQRYEAYLREMIGSAQRATRAGNNEMLACRS